MGPVSRRLPDLDVHPVPPVSVGGVLPEDQETYPAIQSNPHSGKTQPVISLGINLSLVVMIAGPDSSLILHCFSSTVSLHILLHSSSCALQLIVLILVVLLDVDVLCGVLAAVSHHVIEGLVP